MIKLQGAGRRGSHRKKRDWQRSYLIWFFEKMGTLLPISFCLIKFPLGFPSLVDLGCFLLVSRHKSEKPQAESCSDGTKVNPNLCFVLKFLPKWISALHLVLLPRKILSDTLKPVVTIRKGQLNEFDWLNIMRISFLKYSPWSGIAWTQFDWIFCSWG